VNRRPLRAHVRGESLIPRPLILGAGVVIVSVVTLVAGARLAGMEPVGSAESLGRTPAVEVALAFEDRADGGIDVLIDSGAQSEPERITEVAPGEGSFVRGVLRALARARMRAGLAEHARFTLVAWEGGGLTISDPETGAEIELGAFGATNIAAFERFLALARSPVRRDVAALE